MMSGSKLFDSDGFAENSSLKKSTLKAPITAAADDKFCDIFPNFRKK